MKDWIEIDTSLRRASEVLCGSEILSSGGSFFPEGYWSLAIETDLFTNFHRFRLGAGGVGDLIVFIDNSN